MHQSHGIGYAEYSTKLEKRLEVEAKREKNYSKCQQLVTTINQHLFK